MLTHLLLPLDGSELAELALPLALEIARRFESKITLLRVVQPPHLVTTSYDMATIYASLREDMWQEAEAYLNDKVNALRATGYRVKGRIIEDFHVADAILAMAEELAVDAIVMSTHGRGGIRRWVYGSVADRVLQHATMPILLVRAFAEPAEETLELEMPEITTFEGLHSHESG